MHITMKKILVIKSQNDKSADEQILNLLEEAGFDKTTVTVIFTSALKELDIAGFDCAVILAGDQENLSEELQDAARYCANKGIRVIYLLTKTSTQNSIGGTNYGPSIPWSANTLCDVIENNDAVDSVSPKGDIVKTTSTSRGVTCNT